MELYLLLVAVVTVVKFSEGNEENRTFSAVTVGGRVTQYSYPWKPESECILYKNFTTCVNDYPYKNVTSVWTENPQDIKYVSVNCITRGLYMGRHCACANNDQRFSQCQLESIKDYTFRALVNLEVLDLSHNKINSISARALIGLNSLKYLSLRDNVIKTLPMGTLCHTTNLEYTSLSENLLNSYPNDAFRCKKPFLNLTILQCSDNRLTRIPYHALDTFPNLVSIDLSNSSLTDINKSALAGGKSLEFLDLSNNHIPNLFPYFCDYFLNISHIDLHDNAFTSFDFDGLKNCSSLAFLDLSTNSLEHLTGNVSSLDHLQVFNVSDNNLASLGVSFVGLLSLESLDISLNRLWSFPDSLFADLKQLTRLDLSSNLINRTDNFEMVFSGLEGIRSLNLSFNKISFIPNNSFWELKVLEELLLDNNLISELQSLSLAGLKHLDRIQLDNNQLMNLPRDIFNPINDTTPLKQLSLSYNKFSDLSNISKWPLVTSLDITHNKLTSVPSAINFSGMQTFNISHNQIEVFLGKGENLVADFEYLEKLDISFNRISDIRSDIFRQMANLESLNAEQNDIQFNLTTELFQNLPKLKLVNFAQNNIEYIHAIFSDNSLQNLLFLNLSSNPVRHVGMLSQHFNESYLENIDLSACNISVLNAETFFSLHRLKFVDLHGNRFNTFPMFFAQTGTVYNMRDNPLVCDCTMSWLSDRFVALIHENRNISVDTQHFQVPKCAVVSGETYYPDQLSRDQFLCAENDNCDSSCACYKTSPDEAILIVKCQNNMHVVPDVLASSAKTIFLDGNSLSTNTALLPLATSLKMAAKELYLNHSSIRYLPNNTFLPFERLELLDLSHNLITALTTDVFKTQRVLRKLYLNDNLIQTIELNVFNNLDTIQVLDLSGNTLVIISPETTTELLNLDYIPNFYFARNKWHCGCSNVQFKNLVDEVLSKIQDRTQLTCHSGKGAGQEIKDVSRSDFLCESVTSGNNKTLIGILIAVVCVCLLLFAACVYFRRELLSMLYFKTGCHIPGKRRYVGVHFDAYVTYDPTDQHCSYYVQNTIIPKLKNNSYSFQTSSDVIQDVEVTRKVIEDSRCSIFIVDKNFSANDFLVKIFLCATEWCKREKRHKIIMIVHGDIDLVVLEQEIVSRMRKGDYITARSRLWWERLVYELPEPSSSFRHGDEDDDDVVVFSSLAENHGQYEQF